MMKKRFINLKFKSLTKWTYVSIKESKTSNEKFERLGLIITVCNA